MAKIKGTIIVNREQCKGCGVCVTACPVDAISLSEDVNSKGYHISHMVKGDSCIGCAACAMVCPDSCIVVYRQKVE